MRSSAQSGFLSTALSSALQAHMYSDSQGGEHHAGLDVSGQRDSKESEDKK